LKYTPTAAAPISQSASLLFKISGT